MSVGQLLAWTGNVFLISGLYLAGRKWRHAMLLTVAGEILYTVESYRIGRPDFVFLCVVFTILTARNWWLWSGQETLPADR
jgi:hypothetical protein